MRNWLSIQSEIGKLWKALGEQTALMRAINDRLVDVEKRINEWELYVQHGNSPLTRNITSGLVPNAGRKKNKKKARRGK